MACVKVCDNDADFEVLQASLSQPTRSFWILVLGCTIKSH